MEPLEATSDEKQPSAPARSRTHRHFPAIGVTALLILLAFALLVIDYSDVVFTDARRRAALEMLTPDMRLTQAERKLNAAGYVTLYIDTSPAMLQVSTLSKLPFTARVLHRTFPNSPPDVGLRTELSRLTRFYIIANLDGSVRYTDSGEVYTRRIQTKSYSSVEDTVLGKQSQGVSRIPCDVWISCKSCAVRAVQC